MLSHITGEKRGEEEDSYTVARGKRNISDTSFTEKMEKKDIFYVMHHTMLYVACCSKREFYFPRRITSNI